MFHFILPPNMTVAVNRTVGSSDQNVSYVLISSVQKRSKRQRNLIHSFKHTYTGQYIQCTLWDFMHIIYGY